MLKIFQVRPQQYVNRELLDVQARFRKGRGTSNQIANIPWIIEKAKEFQENIYFWFLDCVKPLTVWITTNWKILQEMGIPNHLTCFLRNLCAGQEATVRLDMWQQTGSKLRKEYIKAVYCHPAYLTYMQIMCVCVCFVTQSCPTLCRVYHMKCWAGWSTSWNQDCQEK